MSTILDEFRNDQDAAIRIGSPRESEVKDNVGVARLSVGCTGEMWVRDGTRIGTHLRRRHSRSKYLETLYSVEGSTSLIATSIPRYDPTRQEN